MTFFSYFIFSIVTKDLMPKLWDFRILVVQDSECRRQVFHQYTYENKNHFQRVLALFLKKSTFSKVLRLNVFVCSFVPRQMRKKIFLNCLAKSKWADNGRHAEYCFLLYQPVKSIAKNLQQLIWDTGQIPAAIRFFEW